MEGNEGIDTRRITGKVRKKIEEFLALAGQVKQGAKIPHENIQALRGEIPLDLLEQKGQTSIRVLALRLHQEGRERVARRRDGRTRKYSSLDGCLASWQKKTESQTNQTLKEIQ